MQNTRPTRRLVVVADDFTGATDAGVQFRKAGFAVAVILDPAQLETAFTRSEIVVVDLESRFDTPETAYAKCFTLGRQVAAMGDAVVYKKMDSTFRGNVGAEIDGLLAGLEVPVAFFAPALPVYGRTTQGGEVFVRGTRLSDTEAAMDPRTPVRHSRVRDILAAQTARRTKELSIDALMQGPEDLHSLLMAAIGEGHEILIFDGSTEEHLQQVANAIFRLESQPKLIVGSAGLALYIRQLPAIQRPKVVFVFCGSVSEQSRRQVQYTLDEGRSKLFFLDGRSMLTDRLPEPGILLQVAAAIKEGYQRILFTAALSRQDVNDVFALAAAIGLSRDAASELVAQGIGQLAAWLTRSCEPVAVVLTGGDTAIKTVQALQATGLQIDEEILPGIQSGTLTGCGVRTTIVTKSGGFGKVDAISKTLEYFKV